VAAARPAAAGLLAVAPAGRSAASYTTIRDATKRCDVRLVTMLQHVVGDAPDSLRMGLVERFVQRSELVTILPLAISTNAQLLQHADVRQLSPDPSELVAKLDDLIRPRPFG